MAKPGAVFSVFPDPEPASSFSGSPDTLKIKEYRYFYFKKLPVLLTKYRVRFNSIVLRATSTVSYIPVLVQEAKEMITNVIYYFKYKLT